MKMRKEDFDALCSMIKAHCQNERVDLAYAREQYKVNGLSETRYLFDLLYAIPGVQRQAWFDRGVYQYLNDDHIETALRKAVALLSDEQATSQGRLASADPAIWGQLQARDANERECHD